MDIHLFHHSKIEGEAIRLLLSNNGHRVIYNPDDNSFSLNTGSYYKESILLLDTNCLSENKVEQLHALEYPIILIGHLKNIYWFFKTCEASRGFICKKEKLEELFACIEKLRVKEIFVSPKTSDFLNKPRLEQQRILFKRPLDEYITYTELRIMREIAQGKTAKMIAGEWHRSIHTVYNHRKNIMKKLNLNGEVRLNKFCYQKDKSILSLISLNKNQKIFKNNQG